MNQCLNPHALTQSFHWAFAFLISAAALARRNRGRGEPSRFNGFTVRKLLKQLNRLRTRFQRAEAALLMEGLKARKFAVDVSEPNVSLSNPRGHFVRVY